MSVKQERDDVYFMGRVEFSILPVQYSNECKGVVTVDVSNVRHLLCKNTGATNVSTLSGGADLQQLSVRGDGFSSFTLAGNIVTNTGATKLLAANKVYRFTYYSDIGKWVEDA